MIFIDARISLLNRQPSASISPENPCKDMASPADQTIPSHDSSNFFRSTSRSIDKRPFKSVLSPIREAFQEDVPFRSSHFHTHIHK